MTQTYPLTKTSVRRLYLNTYGAYSNASGTAGVCSIPNVIDNAARRLDATNTVTLGKSPSNWKQEIRRGNSATSSLVGVQFSMKGGDGEYSYRSLSTSFPARCQRGNMYGNFARYIGTFPPTNSIVSGPADQLAREALLGDYLKARKAFRGGNFIAEFRDTVKMMKSPVDSLFKGFNQFIRRVTSIKRLKNRQTYKSRLSDAYLGWEFGWKPLFSDVKEAAEALAKLETSGRFDGRIIKGKGLIETQVSYASLLASLSPLGSIGARTQRTDISRAEVAYRGLMKARPESYSTFADNFGVSAGDILPAIWEAIPWSFFVDYFATANHVLESLQWCTNDIGFINRRVLNDEIARYVWFMGDLPAGYQASIAVEPVEYHSKYKVRSSSGIPYPSLRFRTPSLGQSYNIGALWVSIMASKPPPKLYGAQPGD